MPYPALPHAIPGPASYHTRLPHATPGPAPCHTRPCLRAARVVSWLGAGRDDNDYWTAEVIEEGEWFAGLESLSL